MLRPTPFTQLVGCRLPLQQAGMGGVTTPALAAAPFPPTRDHAADVRAAALDAGTSVSDLRRSMPAADIVEELVRDAEAALAGQP